MVSDSVLDELGFALDPSDYRLATPDRAPAWRLILELRCCCRSASRGGVGGYTVAENRLWWLKLRDIDPLLVNYTVLLVQHFHPAWQLPGDPEQPIHDRIEGFFAERRR